MIVALPVVSSSIEEVGQTSSSLPDLYHSSSSFSSAATATATATATTPPEDGCCPLCGIRLYKIVSNHNTGKKKRSIRNMKKWKSFARGLVFPTTTSAPQQNQDRQRHPKAIPLTIDGRVSNGTCLNCEDMMSSVVPSSNVEGTLYLNGEYNVYGERHGHGELIFPDGKRYVGTFFNGLRFGKGCLLGNGSEYNGDWEFDQFEGCGTYRKANGDVYEGEYSKGLKEGKGKMKFANGDLYSGEFSQDMLHGKGRYYCASESTALEGCWSNGVRHGKFKIQHPSGKLDIVRYENDQLVVGPAVRWSKDRKQTWLLLPPPSSLSSSSSLSNGKNSKKKNNKMNRTTNNPCKYYTKKRIPVVEAVSIGYNCDNEDVGGGVHHHRVQARSSSLSSSRLSSPITTTRFLSNLGGARMNHAGNIVVPSGAWYEPATMI